jgi:hypothetical protein
VSPWRQSILAGPLAALSFTPLLPTPVAADPVGDRPILHEDVVPGHGCRAYRVALRGGVAVTVAVVGDGTGLSLYVDDQRGELLAGNSAPSDQCRICFQPPRDGDYLLLVANRSRRPNHILLGVQ